MDGKLMGPYHSLSSLVCKNLFLYWGESSNCEGVG